MNRPGITPQMSACHDLREQEPFPRPVDSCTEIFLWRRLGKGFVDSRRLCFVGMAVVGCPGLDYIVIYRSLDIYMAV
ncbi:hypothetical protein BJX99DRAFT_240043 [Aspergillus californicus]